MNHFGDLPGWMNLIFQMGEFTMAKIQEVGLLKIKSKCFNAVYFQQDGAPGHNFALGRAFLRGNFPQRWFGTYGPVV